MKREKRREVAEETQASEDGRDKGNACLADEPHIVKARGVRATTDTLSLGRRQETDCFRNCA